MLLDHVALYVKDLEGSRRFFETYFGGMAGNKYLNPKTGLETYFLSFQKDGTRLELMRRPQVSKSSRGLETGYAHISFRLDTREGVDAMTNRLRQDGFAVVSGPRVTGDGYYESCIQDAEENQIELVAP